jgi:hypothetical protein
MLFSLQLINYALFLSRTQNLPEPTIWDKQEMGIGKRNVSSSTTHTSTHNRHTVSSSVSWFLSGVLQRPLCPATAHFGTEVTRSVPLCGHHRKHRHADTFQFTNSGIPTTLVRGGCDLLANYILSRYGVMAYGM